MHSRGKHFEATAVSKSGASRPIWSSDTWDEPPTTDFDPGFAMSKGDQMKFKCTYQNDTGMTLSVGESASTNELCLFFGVYYPAPRGEGLSPVL